MASVNAILFYPMLAMFVLSAIVLMRMFTLRVNAVKAGQVPMKYFKVYAETPAPERMLQASRHFSNLFEAPVLFYVACILGMIFSEGALFVVLAWMYVLARAWHAYIHMGRNKILWRMSAYGVSWLVLTVMWIVLAVHQLFPAPAF